MSRTESFKYQIITRYLEGGISRKDASDVLGKSQRTISRYAVNIRKKGLIAVKHGNTARSPKKKLPQELKDKVIRLIKIQYFDLNINHLRDILKSKHAITLSHSTLWRWCNEQKLVKAPRIGRRTVHRIRPRMTKEGYFLQMDGCHHKFNGKDEWCLIGAIDDATSDIPYAEFFHGETTLNCMKVLKRIIELRGIPKVIYTDQAGWAGGIKRESFTQFKRACDELGIALIFANSAEAKGRIERAWRTIQDRIIPELRLNNLTEMDECNLYLQDKFLPNYWRQACTVKALDPVMAYEPLNSTIIIDDILCVEHQRKIAKDQSISWHGIKFEIISKHSFNLRNYEAVVRHYINGSTKIFVMGHEVGVNTTDRPPYVDPYANKEPNVCLLANFQSIIPSAHKIQEDWAIRQIYGSQETYEKYFKKNTA